MNDKVAPGGPEDRCRGLSAADADGVRPKGLSWDKSDGAVVNADGAEVVLRTERDTDGAGERRKGERERENGLRLGLKGWNSQ